MQSEEIKKFYNTLPQKDQAADYESYRWHKDELAQAGYVMNLNSLNFLIKDCPENQDYLELGPGAGTWTKVLLKQKLQQTIDLVDISSEMLKQAENNLIDLSNLHYIESDFVNFRPNKKYGVFFSCRAFEYLSDQEGAIRHLAELLNQGAWGLIITKNPRYFFDRLLGRKVVKMHLGQINPFKLKGFLQKYGFNKIEIYPITVTCPLFKSAKLNYLAYKILYRFKYSLISCLFTEAYGIKFRKS